MTATEEIKSRLDIVDTISRYIELKQSGSNFKGLCPFHEEKTPSFFIFPKTQTWRCFGSCTIGGDIFEFHMKIENIPLIVTGCIAAFLGAFIGKRLVEKVTMEQIQKLVAVMLIILSIGLGSGVI